MKIGILESKNFSENAIEELGKLGELILFDGKMDAFLKDLEILFIRLGFYIGTEILDKSPKLKIICSPTTGLNHINIEELERRKIILISLKNEVAFLKNIRATPEHTLGLTIALLRNYKEAFLNIENHDWDRNKYFGEELFNNKIGIIGFGRVGQIMANYFKAFGAETGFYDINPEIKPKYGAKKYHSMSELITCSQIICLCASLIPASKPIISSEALDLMRNKYFINTARGELVDEEVLFGKIQQNHFKGVAIDVIDNESRTNRLQDFLTLTKNRNLIITPHIGGATYTSLNKTEEFIVEKLKKRTKDLI